MSGRCTEASVKIILREGLYHLLSDDIAAFAFTRRPRLFVVNKDEVGSGACSARPSSSPIAAPSGIPLALA